MESLPPTVLVYLRDAYLQEFDTTVVGVDGERVACLLYTSRCV